MGKWTHLKFVLEQKERFLERRVWEHLVSRNDLNRVPHLRHKLRETRFTLNLMKRIEETHD